MPAYNFKPKFAHLVERGEKRQTIRPKRRRPTRPGDMLYFYVGMRTKHCRKLGQAVCKDTVPVLITDDFSVAIGGQELSFDEEKILLKADGFLTIGEFYEFFAYHYGLPFEGEIIKW